MTMISAKQLRWHFRMFISVLDWRPTGEQNRNNTFTLNWCVQVECNGPCQTRTPSKVLRWHFFYARHATEYFDADKYLASQTAIEHISLEYATCRFNFYHRVYLVGVCICVWNAVVSLTRHFSTNIFTFRFHCLIIIHGCLSSSCTVKREYRSTTWLAGLHRSIWLNPHSRANCPPNTVDGCGSLTSVAGQSMRSFMLKHC